MISFFRNFFQSKIGLPIFILFLVVVALAFAAADITGSTFGGVAGGDRAALVGDDGVSTSELASSTNAALSQVRQQNPTVTMPEFVEQGGYEEVLDQLIDRYAIGAYAEQYGLRAGENLVNSEILQLGAFRGATGEFDQQVYQAALRQQGLTDAILRRDLSDGLLAQQLLVPAFAAPQMPEKVARQYAALVLERRRGEIAFIPSFAFLPEEDATDAQLSAFYQENRARYVLPERRVIRYALFGANEIDPTALEVTDEEVAKFYEDNAERYAASETRDVSAFLVPTEDAARSFVARIRAGESLETVAREAGFSVSTAQGRTKEEISSTLSFDVYEAVFAAENGSIAEPARSALGWYVARVDGVNRTPAQTLEAASEGIREEIRSLKQAGELANLSASIEEQVDGGTSLSAVAQANNLQIQTTPPVLADGRVFGNPAAQIPPQLAPAIETAFLMDESEPQLAVVVPGAQFIVFDVSDITEAAAPPLAEIRTEVEAGWKLAEGSKLAREAADRILESVRGDTALSAALAAEGGTFPPIERIDLERRELMTRQNGNVPPPLILMFSMAEGSTKLYEGPSDVGWYIVDLEQISTSEIEEGSTLVAQTQQSLAPALRDEYTQQMTKAIREEVGVELNENAIEAVRRQLTGES